MTSFKNKIEEAKEANPGTAYLDGVQAFLAGNENNPYIQGSALSVEWCMGFLDAEYMDNLLNVQSH